MTEREIGMLIGLLIGEGSFGGDGRQPEIVVKMHVRHEKLLRNLLRMVAGSRLYGPYHHGGRHYFQWMIRGDALRNLLPILDAHLTPDIDDHAYERYERMKAAYIPQLSDLPPRRGARGPRAVASRLGASGSSSQREPNSVSAGDDPASPGPRRPADPSPLLDLDVTPDLDGNAADDSTEPRGWVET